QQIPQYKLLNQDMTLSGFKYIFWWEWAHRFLARLIGLVFALPFLVFLVQGRFRWSQAVPLAGLFVLGGLQGAVGWWMVSSGLDAMDPWWRNLFENALTVQFIHRTIAYVIVLYVAALWVWKRGAGGFAGASGWLPRIALLVLLQAGLGISTLLLGVPLPLALG